MSHKIIHVRVGQPAAIVTVDSLDLAAMQRLVGGYIERLTLAPGIDLWCNEEGLYTQAPNRLVPSTRQPIHGDFFIAGDDGEYTIGLTDEQAVRALPAVSSWPMFAHEDPADEDPEDSYIEEGAWLRCGTCGDPMNPADEGDAETCIECYREGKGGPVYG